MFDLCRTLPKYLRTFLHKNEVLMIGLTDQSDYSICLLNVQTFQPVSSVANPLLMLVDVNHHCNYEVEVHQFKVELISSLPNYVQVSTGGLRRYF